MAIHKPHSALILLGHGSTVNPDSSAPTLLHADEIKRQRAFGEVACAFWKEEPSFRQVLYTVESPDIYIVPVFISEGYFTQKIIPRELALAGPITQLPAAHGLPPRTLRYCDPVGNHPGMTALLLQRAREVAPAVDPAHASLVIVGHGTSLNENSGLAVKAQVDRIRALHQYAEVIGMFMEEDPFVTHWQSLTTAPDVIVVPFFVSDGLHSYQDIPVLLGIQSDTGPAASASDVFRHNPYHIAARRLYYASAIGTHSNFSSVILDQVAAFDQQHPARVSSSAVGENDTAGAATGNLSVTLA
jgi:sirohydrochlorin cobaltochelatase